MSQSDPIDPPTDERPSRLPLPERPEGDEREPDDNWTFARPTTEGYLVQLRKAHVELDGEPAGGFTCDDCGARFRCPLVFDWYNTDGDCLASK